jgi:hypothetical protein
MNPFTFIEQHPVVILYLAAGWLTASVISCMPPLPQNSGYFVRWFYAVAQMIGGSLDKVGHAAAQTQTFRQVEQTLNLPDGSSEQNTMKSSITKVVPVLAVAGLLLFGTIGCDSNGQKTASILITTACNSVSALAQLEGYSIDQVKLKADCAAASTAVLNWQAGTPAQNVLEALNLVDDDLDLIPVDNKTKALIDLAIGTVDQVITLVDPSAQPAAGAPVASQVAFMWTAYQKTAARHHHRKLPHPVWDAKDYKKQWNALVAQQAELKKAKQ